MTPDQIEILCNKLKLGKPITPITRVYGGLLHKMWRLDTDNGIFAIKQLSKNIKLDAKTRKSYELTEQIARQFRNKGIPAISSITHDEMSLIDAEGDTFIIYPWVTAKTLAQDEIKVELATKIATLIAKIHSIHLTIAKEMTTEPEHAIHANEKIAILIEKSRAANLPFADDLANVKTLLFSLNEKYQSVIPTLNQKLVISHGDLDQKNVLWDEAQNPILIDWESARLLNPTYEILNAALDWSGVTTGIINDNIFATMIKTYKTANSTINPDSLREMFYAVQGNWLNWLHYNIERSLNTTSPEEKHLSTNQVTQTLKTITYLNSKMNDLLEIAKQLN